MCPTLQWNIYGAAYHVVFRPKIKGNMTSVCCVSLFSYCIAATAVSLYRKKLSVTFIISLSANRLISMGLFACYT
jgi:hypothetical protein